MKLALATGLACAAFAGVAADAQACSCVPFGDPRAELRRADAAFVGVFLRRRPVRPSGAVTSSADPFVYVFRVERAVKGRLPRTIEVRSVRDGASCGLEVRPRQRVALLLRRARGRWHSSLCQQRPATFFRGIPSRRLALCS